MITLGRNQKLYFSSANNDEDLDDSIKILPAWLTFHIKKNEFIIIRKPLFRT